MSVLYFITGLAVVAAAIGLLYGLGICFLKFLKEDIYCQDVIDILGNGVLCIITLILIVTILSLIYFLGVTIVNNSI